MSALEDKLQRAAERACGEPVFFQGLFPIVDTFRGQVVWKGVVHRFERKSGSGSVYAWAIEGGQEPQPVAVLNEPPIKSPLDAVRAWLVRSHGTACEPPKATK